jgi:hypothetical protein
MAPLSLPVTFVFIVSLAENFTSILRNFTWAMKRKVLQDPPTASHIRLCCKHRRLLKKAAIF